MNGQTFLKTLTVRDLKETLFLGQRIAGLLNLTDVIALEGDIGAGKSTFARSLIRTLCPDVIDIPSPTFTLIQTYDRPGLNEGTITHGDFWRLNHPEDALEIGLYDILHQGIFILEWPERVVSLLPPHTLTITFSIPQCAEKEQRDLSFKGSSSWKNRLLPLLENFSPKSLS